MVFESILETASIVGKLILAIIKAIKEKSKDSGFKKKVIFPENQTDFEKLILLSDKLKEIPELWEIQEIREFREKYRVIRYEGKLGMIEKDISNEIIHYKFLESKEKETKQKIDIIPSGDTKNFEEFKKSPKYTRKILLEAFSYLNNNYKSLLSLAVYIEDLYKQNRLEEVAKIKKSIKQRYREEGLRFCNCYQRGYIDRLISGSSRFEVNDKLDLFLKKSIYFVFSGMEEEDIIEIKNKVQEALNGSEDYIAIHSLGGAVPLAKYIAEEIIPPDNSAYDIIKIDKESMLDKNNKKEKIRDYSKIWYCREGREIFLLIKDIL